MSERQRYLAVLATLVLCTGTMGAKCGSSDPTSGSSPGTSTTPNPGGTNPVQTSYFSATQVAPAEVKSYLHPASSFGSLCQIPAADIDPSPSTPPSGNANNDLSCILDAAEADLFFQGMTIDFNAPPGICNYVVVSPYWFWQYQPGEPGNVSYCVSSASATSGQVVSGSVSAANGSLNTRTFVYTCNSDYTGQNGPNCCDGTYTLTVSTSSDGTLGNCTNPQTSTVTYGGQWGNCAGGAGVDLATRKDEHNRPEGFYYPTLASGVNSTFNIVSPNSKNLSANIYIANFFDPTLNSGNPPVALQSQGPAGAPQMYYELECLDSAADILARIRVQIRSWDTVADFTAENNPYTSGDESGFGGNHLWHDYATWQDLETTFIGKY